MSTARADRRIAGRRRGRGAAEPRAPARPGAPPPDGRPPAQPASEESWQPVDVEALSAQWQECLDAAQSAIAAASMYLPAAELGARTKHLAEERSAVARLLEELARDEHAGALFFHRTLPWESRRRLGLPPAVTACVFDLDGVLTASSMVHAAAWRETFDEFLSDWAERTGGAFGPFSRRRDYPAHIHGRPRLEGVRTFLASRGIRLPEGDADDRPGAETVHGLAARKNELLRRRLDREGVHAFAGSRRYLEDARHAGVRRVVVSPSANTESILDHAGLSGLVEEHVDGNMMAVERLRAKPAPDTILAACRRLEVEPEHVAAFETTPAGIRAAHDAGVGYVVAVDRFGRPEDLRAEGPDVVVGDLSELFERRMQGWLAAGR